MSRLRSTFLFFALMCFSPLAAAISSSAGTQILNKNFSAIGLTNVSTPLFNLGFTLLQERGRLYGEESSKLDAFAKGYGVTLLTMQSLSLASFEAIGLDATQVVANIPFFVELENQILGGQDVRAMQAAIRAPMLLLNILYLTKFEPYAHEYSFLTDALTTMLKTQSVPAIMDQALPFGVYMRAIRKANFTATPAEETAFISYLAQQIKNGTSPVTAGDYGIRALIVLRAARLGYVPLSPSFDRDINELVIPMLAQNKSADQIVGELVNNVTLHCMNVSVPGTEEKKKVAASAPKKVQLKDILYAQVGGRRVAQQNKRAVVDFQAIKKFKTKSSIKNSQLLMVRTRKVEIHAAKVNAKTSYVISVPNAGYQQAVKEQLLVDIKRLAPQARVLNSINSGINLVLVDGLTPSDLKIILEHGYDVSENKPVQFQSVATCPATQFSNEVITSAKAGELIGASSLHAQGVRGQGIKIGFVDTGIHYQHPDFECPDINSSACRIRAGTFRGLDSASLADPSGHGTHVSSIALGKNGIAPAARALVYPISSLFDIMEALSAGVATDKPAVVNLSLNIPEGRDMPLAQLADQLAVNSGVSIVAAAGNCSLMRQQSDTSTCGDEQWDGQGFYSLPDQKKIIGAPGIAKRAIAVSVTDRSDNYGAVMSLTGPQLDNTSLLKPDLVAPGRLICAAGASQVETSYGCGVYHVTRGGFFGWCDDEHAVLSGSSMATPMVSGSVALLKQKFPDWNVDEIKSALRLTANSQVGNLSTFGLFERGAGRIDVLKASTIQGHPPVIRIDRVEQQTGSQSKGFVISGAAYDRDVSLFGLKEYRVSIGKGEKPQNYTHLKSFSRSVGSLQNNEVLMAFGDVPSCFSGKYILKIEAEDGAGNVASDYTMVSF